MHYSSLRRAKSCPGPAGSEKMQGSEPRHRKPAPGGGLWAHGRRPGLPREERLAFWSRAVPLPVRVSTVRAVFARGHLGTGLPAPADPEGGGSACASEAGGGCVPRAAALATCARAQRRTGPGGLRAGVREACAPRPCTQLAGVGWGRDGTAVNLRARPWSALIGGGGRRGRVPGPT